MRDHLFILIQDALYVILNSTVTRFRDLIGAPNAPRWNAVLFNGFLTSLFCWLQFLSAPLLGSLSDRHGRRPLLLITTVYTVQLIIQSAEEFSIVTFRFQIDSTMLFSTPLNDYDCIHNWIVSLYSCKITTPISHLSNLRNLPVIECLCQLYSHTTV